MYTKEGPGVPKDAPKKTGFKRFFELISRNFMDFWKASMLLTLCCVPMGISLVPGLLFPDYLGMLLISGVLFVLSSALVGPALVSMHAIIVFSLRDEPFFFWHAYKKAWKENWKQASKASMMFSALAGLEVLAGSVYLKQENQTISAIFLAMILLGLLVVATCWLFTMLQMLYLAMPLRTMLKNSLLIAFGYANRAMVAGLICVITVAAIILLFPISILLLMVGLPGIFAVIADMWAWPTMEKTFQITQQLEDKKQNSQ